MDGTDREVIKRQAAEEGAGDDMEIGETSVEVAETLAREPAPIVLDDKDILLGRGKGASRHPGNIRMRRIADKYRAGYQAVGRGEKALLVKKVYDELKRGGTKFLKPSEKEDGLEEVSDQAALEKVGHSLRCSKRWRKCDANHPTTISSQSEPTALPLESTSWLNAAPLLTFRSPQPGQNRMFGPQYTTAMTMAFIQAGLIPHLPLLRRNETMIWSPGVPSLFPVSLPPLEAYLVEMERDRVRSALLVTTGQIPHSGALSGAITTSQIDGMLHQNQQVREFLLQQHSMSSQWPELPLSPRHPKLPPRHPG